MIRDGDVQIPHDPSGEAQPSWHLYYGRRGDPAYPDDPRWGISLVCACGKRAILRSMEVRTDGTFGHDIDQDGTVSPSIHCTHCCGWHVWGRLVGWTGPAPVAPYVGG